MQDNFEAGLYTEEQIKRFKTSTECLCVKEYPKGFKCCFCDDRHGVECFFTYKCANDRYDCGVAVWCCRNCNDRMSKEPQLCVDCIADCCGITCPANPREIDFYKLKLVGKENPYKYFEIVYGENASLTFDIEVNQATIHQIREGVYLITMKLDIDVISDIMSLFLQIGALAEEKIGKLPWSIANKINKLRICSELKCRLQFIDENQNVPHRSLLYNVRARINPIRIKVNESQGHPLNIVAYVI